MGRWIAILAGLVGGLLGFWKKPPLLVVLAINLIPVAGVLWFGWSALALLLLYWIENVFVGVFNTLKLRAYERHVSGVLELFRLSNFFVLHYGMFTLVHGIFAVLIGTVFAPEGASEAVGLGRAGGGFEPWSFLIAVASIGALQLADFLRWRADKGWQQGSANRQMFAPYGRIVVMHITIIGGAAVLGATGMPASYIALLAVLKTFIEAGWSLANRNSTGASSAAGLSLQWNGRSFTIGRDGRLHESQGGR